MTRRASPWAQLSFIRLPLSYRAHHHGRTGRPVFSVTTAQWNSPWTSHSSVWPTSATVVSEKQRASSSSIHAAFTPHCLSSSRVLPLQRYSCDQSIYGWRSGDTPRTDSNSNAAGCRIELESKGKGCCAQMFETTVIRQASQVFLLEDTWHEQERRIYPRKHLAVPCWMTSRYGWHHMG